jgi:hypothetical protein
MAWLPAQESRALVLLPGGVRSTPGLEHRSASIGPNTPPSGGPGVSRNSHLCRWEDTTPVPTSRLPSRPQPDPPGLPEPQLPQRDAVLPDEAPASVGEPAEKIDYTVLGELERLAIGRVTLTMPSTVFDPAAPMVAMPMLDFRERLLRGKVPQEAKDRAWRRLDELARVERGEWNLFALGTGYPLLRKEVDKLTVGRSWLQQQQVHFTLAIEFLFALHRLDLDPPWVFNRLVDAAYTHASGRKRRPAAWTYDLDQLSPDQAPVSPYGNPQVEAEIADANRVSVSQVLDQVITRANAVPGRQRITDVQATLITRTDLDRERLRDVAADLKLGEPSASKQRARAANLIARLLGRPDLADPPRPRAAQPASAEPAHTVRGPQPGATAG